MTSKSDPAPLRTFTFKDGDEIKEVKCFSEEQIVMVEGYIKMRKQFEIDCKEELALIDKGWDLKKKVLAKRHEVQFREAKEKKA